MPGAQIADIFRFTTSLTRAGVSLAACTLSERLADFAVIGSAAVTALGAAVAGVGLSRLDAEEAMLADDAAELEATAATKQGSQYSSKEGQQPREGRVRIKKS